MNHENRMNWKRLKSFSERQLRYVESSIKSRDGMNWIPDELSTAILWLMEGYIAQKGIEPLAGNGWSSTKTQFSECSSKFLASESSSLLAKAYNLEFFMFETDTELWLKDVEVVLSDVKDFIKAIENELFESDDESASQRNETL